MAVGELAVNLADKRLFTKQSDGTIIELSTNPTDLDVATLRIDGVEITASAAELNKLDGFTGSTAELNLLDGLTATTVELNTLDGITASTAELNKLDGYTGSTAELNILDGVTATTAEINKLDGFTGTVDDLNYAKDLRATGVTTAEFDKLDGLTATTAELNITDGLTATTAELNTLDGITSTTAELNILDGVTATTTELNYTDGVTSNIQTQLDAMVEKSGDTMTGDLDFGDNVKAKFGAGDDLQIYHDGSDSIIVDNGTGDLLLRGSNSIRLQSHTGETYFKGDLDGAVKIYHNNTEKLATTSTGVDVTGTVTADSLTVDTTSDNTLVLGSNTSARGARLIKNYGDFGFDFFYSYHATTEAGVLNFKGSQDSTQLQINSNGDVSFYEDTGTTAKMVWDASAETLGVGNSVSGDINASSAIADVVVGSGSGASGLTVYSGSDSYGALCFADGTSGTPAYQSYLKFDHTNNALSYIQNNTERMRIDSSGNVGIANSSPVTRLDIDGFITLRNSAYPSPATGVFKDGFIGSNDGTLTYAVNGASNGAYGSHKFQVRKGDSSDAIDAMIIGSSGNVGIGTNNPIRKLHIYESGTGNVGVEIDNPQTGEACTIGKQGNTAYGATSVGDTHLYTYDSNITIMSDGGAGNTSSIKFATGGSSERARIDSSGNLLIGTTASAGVGVGDTNTGHVFGADGWVTHSRTGNTTLYVNRNSTDGTIIDLRKDGSPVGSIGAEGGDLVLGTGSTAGLQFNDATPTIRPWNMSSNSRTDGVCDLGYSNSRFKDLYLSGQTRAGNLALTSGAVATTAHASKAVSTDNSASTGLKTIIQTSVVEWQPIEFFIRVCAGRTGLENQAAAWYQYVGQTYNGTLAGLSLVDSGGNTGSFSLSFTQSKSGSVLYANWIATAGGFGRTVITLDTCAYAAINEIERI